MARRCDRTSTCGAIGQAERSRGSPLTRATTCSASGIPSHFVNAGSVGCGSPEDGRAQYAVIDLTSEDVQVNFRSIAYDRASVEQDLAAAGLSVDLLRVPPVPHPLLDPGLETLASA